MLEFSEDSIRSDANSQGHSDQTDDKVYSRSSSVHYIRLCTHESL